METSIHDMKKNIHQIICRSIRMCWFTEELKIYKFGINFDDFWIGRSNNFSYYLNVNLIKKLQASWWKSWL